LKIDGQIAGQRKRIHDEKSAQRRIDRHLLGLHCKRDARGSFRVAEVGEIGGNRRVGRGRARRKNLASSLLDGKAPFDTSELAFMTRQGNA
jgi:hypothetical protein